MANVLFKRGLETDLFKSGKTYTDGCFYLTTDTNRLYVGKGETIVPVNEGVISVDNVSALSNAGGIAGSFYYAKAENILCVYNGQKWIQINANSNEYYKVETLTLNKAVDASTKEISISAELTMKKYDNHTGTPVEIADSEIKVTGNTIKITAEDFNTITAQISVGLNQVLTDKTLKISTTGEGADTSKVAQLVAGNNVSFKANADGSVEISSLDTNTTYTVATAAKGTDKAVVTLTEVNGAGEVQTITYQAGDKIDIAVENGEIVYKHETATVARPTATAGSVDENRKFTVVTGVEDDGYGHMSKVVTQTFTLPEDQDVYVTEATYEEEEGATNGVLTLKRQGENNLTVDLGLTADEIDRRIGAAVEEGLEGLTALNYKGTVGTGGTILALPLTAAAGDMYMASSDSAEGEPVEYHTGDLVIASGEEVNGVIANPTWTVVPSGNDLHTDTQYKIQAATAADGAKLELYNKSTNLAEQDAVNLTDDGVVEVAQVSATEIKLSHANKTVTQTTATEKLQPAHGGEISVVTAVTADEKGHVASVVTTPIVLPADQNTVYEISAGVDNQVGTITLTGTPIDGVKTTDKVEIVSGTDVVIEAGNTDQIKVSHAAHAGTETTANSGIDNKTFEAVTELTLSNGHIDGYKTTTYTLPDYVDTNTTYDLTGSTAVADNKATFATVLTGNDNLSDTVNHYIASDSLTLSAATEANTVNINMTWGTF